jgi:hypothetical protein
MQINFSEEQLAKAPSSILTSCDPDSNVNVESEEQRKKHRRSRISTDAGMQMERRDVHEENASDLISFEFETARNVTSERIMHSKKHITPITSIDEGTGNKVRERSAISSELSSVAGILSGTGDEVLDIQWINGLPRAVHLSII